MPVNRWGRGVKLVAAGWLALLTSAWVHKEIGLAAVTLSGIVPGALYWILGTVLAESDENRP